MRPDPIELHTPSGERMSYWIRPVHSDLLGSGYELYRKRWFGNKHIEYAWLKYDKEAFNTLNAIAQHMLGAKLPSKGGKPKVSG